jgi:hypothetical protein
MYCSHLLSAASVFNCRWLYYTQEDANGMYAAACGLRHTQCHAPLTGSGTHDAPTADRSQDTHI